MLRLNPFELHQPATIEEAVALLASSDNALLIAGGTDVIPKMKREQFEPRALVSLAMIEGLDEISSRDGQLTIGALATLWSLEHAAPVSEFGALHDAVRSVATPIIRRTATLGGNLLQDTRCRYYDRSPFWRETVGFCMKKDADTCRVAKGGNKCYASFCSDIAPALAVLDGRVTLSGPDKRTVGIEQLYVDDGMAHVSMLNEILTSVTVPSSGYRSTYKKLRPRGSFDFPEVGVAVALSAQGPAMRINVALTGVASDIFVMRDEVSRDALPKVIDAVHSAIKPMDTMHFSPAYRKSVAKNLLVQAVDELLSD